MSLNVLHVIQALSRGGASRSVLATAAAASGPRGRHRVASLGRADPWATTEAQSCGLPVIEAPSRAALVREIEAADIVQIHFWNSPELYELLTGSLPPMRLLITSRVSGEHPPHVITPELVALADVMVACTPQTARVAAFAQAPCRTAIIHPSAGWGRVQGVSARPHPTFNVGYVGTVEATKMHPDYVSMSARVSVPGVKFIVCGSGNGFKRITQEAQELGVGERFELLGYVEDIGRVFAELDVLGYPLCPENYSATELVIQEAMYCGIPPVVMPFGGAGASVEHGRTGLVVADQHEYTRAIEALYSDPQLRRRLGETAAEHARAAWNPDQLVKRWLETYAQLAQEPKRSRSCPAPRGWSRQPSELFADSLGTTAPEFRASMRSADPQQALRADEQIANATPVMASPDSGGILHWRRHFPRDPWLRLWSGLVLARAGRRALAAGEFHAAARLGLSSERAGRYLAETISAQEARAS